MTTTKHLRRTPLRMRGGDFLLPRGGASVRLAAASALIAAIVALMAATPAPLAAQDLVLVERPRRRRDRRFRLRARDRHRRGRKDHADRRRRRGRRPARRHHRRPDGPLPRPRPDGRSRPRRVGGRRSARAVHGRDDDAEHGHVPLRRRRDAGTPGRWPPRGAAVPGRRIPRPSLPQPKPSSRTTPSWATCTAKRSGVRRRCGP